MPGGQRVCRAGGQIPADPPQAAPCTPLYKKCVSPLCGAAVVAGAGAECDNDGTDQYLCDGPHLAPAQHITSELLSTATIDCL